MSYEFLIVLIILAFITFSDKIKCLYLLVFLLPFHSFIKYFLSFLYGGGGIFSYWKELTILIFTLKTFSSPRKKFDKAIYIYSLIIVMYLSLFFLINIQNYSAALVKFRDIVFPYVLFLSISVSIIKETQIRNIILLFSISFLIISITGFLEIFGGYRELFVLITQKIKEIAPDGIIYYPDSMMILGYNRMMGIMEGPNHLGLYTSVFLLSAIGLGKEYKWKNITDKFIVLSIIVAFFVLLFSFSRTAIATVIISLYLYFRKSKQTNLGKVILFILLLAIIYSFLSIAFPQVQDVFERTIKGQEPSSASRGYNFTDGLDFVLSQPWGHGLGSTYIDNTGNIQVYFAESAFINICIELGIVGLILVIGYDVLILRKLKPKISVSKLSRISYCLIFSTIITSFVSVNPSEPTYTFFLWMLVGLSFSHIVTDINNDNSHRLQTYKI